SNSPLSDSEVDPMKGFGVPPVDLPVEIVVDRLLSLVLSLQNRYTTYHDAFENDAVLAAEPHVAKELTTKRPLFGPSLAERGSSLFVETVRGSSEVKYGVQSTGVKNRITRLWMKYREVSDS